MIELTRLNKERLMVNADLIKFVEQLPDTVITLMAGDKIVVREKPEEVVAKVIAFRRAIAPPPSLPGGPADSQTFPVTGAERT